MPSLALLPQGRLGPQRSEQGPTGSAEVDEELPKGTSHLPECLPPPATDGTAPPGTTHSLATATASGALRDLAHIPAPPRPPNLLTPTPPTPLALLLKRGGKSVFQVSLKTLGKLAL